jgi:hypothetical protein
MFEICKLLGKVTGEKEKEKGDEEEEKKEKILDFNNHFKLPIFYSDKKVSLKKHIINDLELIETIDPSCNPMYHYLFNSKKDETFTKKMIEQMSEYYTTDTDFLKDNQELIKNYSSIYNVSNFSKKKKKMSEVWSEIKEDNGFKDRYYYIDWKMGEFLNKSEHFLQFMSIYNLASPVISLLMPLIILIIPFFIIKFKGLTLSITDYIEVLKNIISNHAIGKLFTKFNDVDMNQKIYMLISAAFYVFSIYQNITICLRFNKNMKKIHTYFKDIQEYLENTISSSKNYLINTEQLKSSSHVEFNRILREKTEVLKNFKTKIEIISNYEFNYKKAFEIGHILKTFYELYEDPIYNDAFMYSFGFNGYLDCLSGLKENFNERKINVAHFLLKKEKKSNKITNNYYAALKDGEPIKNDIAFKKNMIITGPNASGKTTVLKSTLINIIFTQQFGVGFYDSMKICPYKHIHCYLNIPDTSGRDSLFQAEARRCKEILDVVDSNKGDTHYCAFDELYSGTNPDEAITSATAFMEYLVKNANVSCLLTTHFVKVCKNLKKNKVVENYHMKTDKHGSRIKYLYKLEKGISAVKGGINVLSDMNYPQEIIDSTIRNS